MVGSDWSETVRQIETCKLTGDEGVPLAMGNTRRVQPIYTDSDYNLMGWHDCTIYGLSLPKPDEHELILDLDYVFEWIDPSPPSKYYSFMISRSTLCFEGVHGLKVDVETDYTLKIDSLTVEPSSGSKLWIIECQEGVIRLNASGFKQYTRELPQRSFAQVSGRPEGCNFSKSTFEELKPVPGK